MVQVQGHDNTPLYMSASIPCAGRPMIAAGCSDRLLERGRPWPDDTCPCLASSRVWLRKPAEHVRARSS